MKKILIAILIVGFSATGAFAQLWCQNDGNDKGINCQSDNKGYLLINGFPTVKLTSRIAKGFFPVTIVEPDVAVNQKKTSEDWTFADNAFIKTWFVADMTDAEVDAFEAAAMNEDVYWIWKALRVLHPTVTVEQLVNFLPADQVDGYKARARVEAAQ